MAPFLQNLKALFNWSGSRRPSEVKAGRGEISTTMQPSSPADRYHDEMGFDQQKRQDRYDVYDAMDNMSDVATVLDAYSEDCTQLDQQRKRSVWVEAKDSKLAEAGNKLLHDVLNAEHWIEGLARDLGKYGDDFAVIHTESGKGITSLLWRDPRDIERIENQQGILTGFEETSRLGKYRQNVAASINSGGDGSDVKPTYEPWDMMHWRIYRRKRLPRQKWPNIYGTSLLAGSERIAKQMKILDDLLMIMRITRSLDRHTYFVDVGRSPVEEEVRILKRWRRALKRKTYVDPATGRFDSRFDPYAWTEDEFWPVKENSNSRVETQAGITDISEVADIDYFRDKFYGSLRAPKAFFGFEGDINAKATLSSQSLKWARAVNTLQRSVRTGLKRLCQIHFAYLGLPTDEKKFEIMMVPPSLIEVLDKLEAWQQIIDVAERMSAVGEQLELKKRDWSIYILKNVLWLSDQEVGKFIRGLGSDEEISDGATTKPSPQPEPERPGEPATVQPPPKGEPGEPQAEPQGEPGQPKESIGGNGKINKNEIDEAIRRVVLQQPTHGVPANELPPPYEPAN